MGRPVTVREIRSRSGFYLHCRNVAASLEFTGLISLLAGALPQTQRVGRVSVVTQELSDRKLAPESLRFNPAHFYLPAESPPKLDFIARDVVAFDSTGYHIPTSSQATLSVPLNDVLRPILYLCVIADAASICPVQPNVAEEIKETSRQTARGHRYRAQVIFFINQCSKILTPSLPVAPVSS